MEEITIALVLLVAVVASAILARLIARVSPVAIPLPLVQIALGAAIASSAKFSVVLEPHIFFLLFLPPLLFVDGWRIPKEGLFRDKGTILELAFGLVLFTVVGVGFFINWLIPGMPLAVAFALAAILSPTDPIAVTAIAKRAPIPKRLMHILEGESLLNDASGLVCMQFAIAAALTGVFHPGSAVLTFFQLAIGGLAIGIGITKAVISVKNYVAHRLGEETGSQILISLLIPFGAYLLAERLHCSGILAAVSAGITMSYAEQGGQALAVTRMRRTAVWDTVQFTLNGIIFVLLGEQLPNIAAGAARVVRETGHHEPAWLVFYVLAITLALGLLRFAWVWVSFRFTKFSMDRKSRTVHKPSWRLIAATSLAGVRGAITLAGVLTLPLILGDGTPFPARDLAIFLAAGVIITSMVVASIGLPLLLHRIELPPEPHADRQERRARLSAAEAAIKAIEERQHALGEGKPDADLYAEAAARVMEGYRHRIEGKMKTGVDAEQLRKVEEIERQLILAGVEAERNEYYRLSRMGHLSDDISRKLVREADLVDARYANV